MNFKKLLLLLSLSIISTSSNAMLFKNTYATALELSIVDKGIPLENVEVVRTISAKRLENKKITDKGITNSNGLVKFPEASRRESLPAKFPSDASGLNSANSFYNFQHKDKEYEIVLRKDNYFAGGENLGNPVKIKCDINKAKEEMFNGKLYRWLDLKDCELLDSSNFAMG